MSRIISGKVRLDMQQVDLAHLLRGAAEALQPSAQANGIQVQQALDREIGPVRGDPGRLQQVVWNLLTNAVKFTPRGGKIELRLNRAGSQAQIVVSDTGQGIHPDFLPHVFQRFRQADSSTTRMHGGLGLGLSIVKQLVELHGGSCDVDSAGVGQGATFTISLPLPRAEDGDAAADSFERRNSLDCASVRLDGITVLVVDDEPDSRRLVARLLADRDAQVLTASGAQEAIELLKVHRPQVLVSDIGMPGMDGYQLIREVRARLNAQGRSMPAVALTAFARSEDRTRAMLAGFQAHLSKPLEPHELIATVATLAGRTGRTRSER